MASVSVPTRSLAGEYGGTLDAQSQALSQLLGLQSQYAPYASGNQLSQLQTLLMGTRGGNMGPRDPNQPQAGLLSLYTGSVAPQLQTSQEALTRSQRAADIGDISNLGPQALQSLQSSDPATAGLLNRMTGQATSQVGMGTALDPGLMRLVSQGVRARQSGMLAGTGNAGDFGEALGLSQFGQNLYQQRLGNANNVLALRQSIYGSPFQSIFSRGNAGFGPSSGVIGGASGMQGSSSLNFLNPESPYAQDLYNTNFNAQVNRSIANANNNDALIAAGIKAIGGIAGGALAGI